MEIEEHQTDGMQHNMNYMQDCRYKLDNLVSYVFNGVQIYLNRRKQIFHHMGQDETNKESLGQFNR